MSANVPALGDTKDGSRTSPEPTRLDREGFLGPEGFASLRTWFSLQDPLSTARLGLAPTVVPRFLTARSHRGAGSGGSWGHLIPDHCPLLWL